MNAHLQSTNAGNVGARLGRVCRKLMRREKQFAAWLIKHRMPAGAANASVWIIRLAVLTVVLYFSLIVGALIAALLIVASVLAHADVSSHKKDEYEWRDGLLGYGMYNRDGVRIDPYDPDEEP